MVLLVSAGLLARGLQRARAVDLGFATSGVVFTEYDLRRQGYSSEEASTFNASLLQFASALPGVTAAALTSHVPLHGGVVRHQFRPDGRAETVPVTISAVSAGYFRALDIPVSAGRVFTQEESDGHSRVAVISEGLAARFWAGRTALGESVRPADSAVPLTIVGVVHDTTDVSLWRDKEMAVYEVAGLADSRDLHLLIKTSRDRSTLLAALAEKARVLDPRVRFSATTLDELLQLWILPSKVGAIAAAVLGSLALFLACVGVYGVLGCTVRQRTREIGIRMALGASRGDVMRLVLREGGRLIAAGLAVGAGGAAVAARVLHRFVFDLGTVDVLTFTLVPLCLAAVALAACYFPARLASQVEPLEALRAP
jgi:predicted permease